MKQEFRDSTDSCILRMQAMLDSLSPAQQQAANYILQNPEKVLSSTINDLANQTDTSYATIARLMEQLGYSGFKEFKKHLYRDTLDSKTLDFVDVITFSQGADTEEISDHIYALSANILEESRKILDIKAMERAADKIVAANTLCIVGTGLSGICARYAYSRFFRIGIDCFYDSDRTHYTMKAALLKKGDALLAISSSGRSKSILQCAEIAQKNEVDIITLSDFAISPLSSISDTNLFTTPRNVSQFLNIDMPLLIGQIYIIDALYMCCCVKMGKTSSELFVKTKDAIEAEKTDRSSIIKTPLF